MDCLELAEDPWTSEVIYLHKYFQIFYYFIPQSSKIAESGQGNTSDRLVVVEDASLRRGVISLYHDPVTAGHPGISNTTWAITCDFWWLALKKDVTEYVKGCTLCQSRKNQPNKAQPPLFPISSETYSTPFSSITLDFIIKLPLSESYDTILTITDTFSKASIFIPCNETIDAAKTAKLYTTYVLPHYGLPSCIISDQDPRFTSSFSRELC